MPWFNHKLTITLGEDPFPPEVIRAEPGFRPLPLDEARRVGREVTRHVINTVLPPDLLKLGDRLGLRMDRFPLGPDTRPQSWHFDPSMSTLWSNHCITGVIVFGSGTGETDVADPFEVNNEPQNEWEAHALADQFNDGRRVSFQSYPTGTLIVSKGPFLHRRGRSFPGLRLALDFGILNGRKSRAEEAWDEWQGLI